MKIFIVFLTLVNFSQAALAGVDIIASVAFHDRNPDSFETAFRDLNKNALVRCAYKLTLPEDRVYVYQTSETLITGRWTKTMWAHFDCSARGASVAN
jgi:hypothetical protein